MESDLRALRAVSPGGRYLALGRRLERDIELTAWGLTCTPIAERSLYTKWDIWRLAPPTVQFAIIHRQHGHIEVKSVPTSSGQSFDATMT
jgi:hypothetical protein